MAIDTGIACVIVFTTMTAIRLIVAICGAGEQGAAIREFQAKQ
jgi:hypothetical protein